VERSEYGGRAGHAVHGFDGMDWKRNDRLGRNRHSRSWPSATQ
jgi:hypothetical protein